MSEEMPLRDSRAALSLFRGREVDDRHGGENRRDGYRGRGTALVCTTMMVDGDPRTGLFTHQTAPQIAQAQYDTQACWNARVLGEQLGHALESRSEIEQAKGIIMAITRCSADEAFLQFLRQSQRHNLKPRELAQEIVARSDRFREGEGRSRHGASR